MKPSEMEKFRQWNTTKNQKSRTRCAVLCCMAMLAAVLSAGCAGASPQPNASSPAPSAYTKVDDPALAAELLNGQSSLPAAAEQSNQSGDGMDASGVDAGTDNIGADTTPAKTDSSKTDAGTDDASAGTNASSASKRTSQTNANNSDIGLEAAKDAALAHAGLNASDVTFIKEKSDYDDGIFQYELEFVTAETKYEYDIKAADGTILESSQEPIVQTKGGAHAHNNHSSHSHTPSQSVITLEEAKAIALDYAGLSESQVSFSKLELDYDDDLTEYEIEFYAGRTEYSFSIDASTGKILEAETDFD